MDRPLTTVYLMPAIAICVLVTVALSPSAPSASPPPPTFPERIAGWRAAERATFDRSTLFSFIDGGAEVYLAYDFRQVWVVTYHRAGASDIMAEVYDMGSGQDAYGVLSIDLTGEEVQVGSMARYGAGLIRLCKGRWFIRVLAETETPETRAAVMALGRELAGRIKEESLLPDLLSLLPPQGLKPNATTFLHTRITLNQLYYLADENLLQLGPETEAVLADYQLGKAEAKLLVVRYPERARCLKAEATFRARYLEKAAAGAAGNRLVQRVEGKRFAAVQAKPPYLAIVLEAPSAKLAGELLDQVAERLPGGKSDGSPSP